MLAFPKIEHFFFTYFQITRSNNGTYQFLGSIYVQPVFQTIFKLQKSYGTGGTPEFVQQYF